MTVPPLFAPKNPATQAACKTAALREMFVCPNHACRCALEMQPGKITRESAHPPCRISAQSKLVPYRKAPHTACRQASGTEQCATPGEKSPDRTEKLSGR